jgi:cardiolipin synthase
VVLAGAAVAWNFELLPRWALAVLAAREAAMVAITLAGLRLGLDISINWIGRIAVWPTMAGLGIALIADSWVADALFLAGVAGSIVATFLYVSDGIRRLRMRRTTLDSQNSLQDFGAR